MQEQSQEETTPTTNKLEKPPTRGYALLLSILAMVLAIISLVLHFFLWDMQYKTSRFVIYETKQLEANFEPKFNKLSSELANQQRMLNTLMANFQSGEKKKSLMIAEEAEHLMTIARHILIFQNDIQIASRILEEADQKLQQLDDPAINPIRQELVGYITNLHSVQPVDVSALLSRISAISNQVEKLSSVPVLPAEPASKPTIKQKLTWKEKLIDTLHNLKGIVSIRRLPEPVKPLASTETQMYLSELIRLKLSEAEWGVLHQNPVVYQNSLEQAKLQLQKYYFKNPTGANLIRMIDELQQINIKPSVPDLSNIISNLHLYIQNKTQTFSTPTTTPNVGTPLNIGNPVPRALPS